MSSVEADEPNLPYTADESVLPMSGARSDDTDPTRKRGMIQRWLVKDRWLAFLGQYQVLLIAVSNATANCSKQWNGRPRRLYPTLQNDKSIPSDLIEQGGGVSDDRGGEGVLFREGFFEIQPVALPRAAAVVGEWLAHVVVEHGVLGKLQQALRDDSSASRCDRGPAGLISVSKNSPGSARDQLRREQAVGELQRGWLRPDGRAGSRLCR